MVLGMGEKDLRFDIFAQRSFHALQGSIALVTQHLVDGTHTVGALGVAEPRVVLDEDRVRDEQGCHDPDRSFLSCI